MVSNQSANQARTASRPVVAVAGQPRQAAVQHQLALRVEAVGDGAGILCAESRERARRTTSGLWASV